MEKEYKALFVKEETHKRFSKEAKDDGRTFDKFLNNLLDIWEKKKQSKNK